MQIDDAIVELIGLALSFDVTSITELMEEGDIDYVYNDTTIIRYTASQISVTICIKEGDQVVDSYSQPFEFFDDIYKGYLHSLLSRQG